MSYTNQEVSWSHIKSEPDKDTYGDLVRGRSTTLKARKQVKRELVRYLDGREVVSRTYYYIDPIQFPEALKIERLDTLDGEIVEDVYIMVSLAGKPKMIRVMTR